MDRWERCYLLMDAVCLLMASGPSETTIFEDAGETGRRVSFAFVCRSGPRHER